MTQSITRDELTAQLGAVTLLDVRKRPAYDEDTAVIAGAAWRDPAAIDEWGGGVAPGTTVVCYCVHGHEVSQGAAAALRARGLDARYLEGGIEDWKAAGGALDDKP